MFSWRAKRQLFYLAVFVAVAGFVLWQATLWVFPASTCFDNKQNQDEEGVDCGGVCERKCVGEVKELSVLWQRALKVGEGRYDVVALVENPNIFAGTKSLSYTVRLYDNKNVLVAVREGSTFVNSNERFVIFESDVFTREKIPARAAVEFADPSKTVWERADKEKPKLIVAKKSFVGGNAPYAEALIRNDDIFPIKDVEVAAILFDTEQNVVGVSLSKVGVIEAESVYTAFFTWPLPFSREAQSIDIVLRANQTK